MARARRLRVAPGRTASPTPRLHRRGSPCARLCRLGGPKYRGARTPGSPSCSRGWAVLGISSDWSPSRTASTAAWGFAHFGPPRKPAVGQAGRSGGVAEPVGDGVRAGGACALRRLPRRDDPAFGRAMRFVCNCHNFADDPAPAAAPPSTTAAFLQRPGRPRRARSAGVAGDRPPRPRAALPLTAARPPTAFALLLACGLPRDVRIA